MTSITKADQNSQYQRNTVVKDNKAIQTMEVQVFSVEDKGEYLYVGYRPSGKDIGMCAFGVTRIYKESSKEYGTLGFEAKYNYQDVMKKEVIV